jgi:uncharacterized protein
MSALAGNVLMFGRLLRRAGIDVHPGRLLDVITALGLVDLATRDEVYHTCRTLLVSRREQIPMFDRAFAAFWRARHERSPDMLPGTERDAPARTDGVAAIDGPLPVGAREGPEDVPGELQRALKTWSDRGGLAAKDFAAFTGDELTEAAAALSHLVWNPGERRTRRWVRGRGPRIDLRRAIAESLRTGGDVVKLETRARRSQPRPLVLLCDVSGSMERYSRMLLHFAHAIARRHRRVEVFLFSTRLTRTTRELRRARPDDALAAAAEAVSHWSGGTRIGTAVKEFHQRWGRRALHGGPVVLLISDGWDRGDPEELRAQIARLQRACHRLIWLNPLIGTADYAPLTRGLQAALPFVDEFLPVRNLANLADLARHLNALA